MDTVELSGGDFGGETVEVKEGEDQIVLENESGTWTYDRGRHPGGRQMAHLVRFDPAK